MIWVSPFDIWLRIFDEKACIFPSEEPSRYCSHSDQQIAHQDELGHLITRAIPVLDLETVSNEYLVIT